MGCIIVSNFECTCSILVKCLYPASHMIFVAIRWYFYFNSVNDALNNTQVWWYHKPIWLPLEGCASTRAAEKKFFSIKSSDHKNYPSKFFILYSVWTEIPNCNSNSHMAYLWFEAGLSPSFPHRELPCVTSTLLRSSTIVVKKTLKFLVLDVVKYVFSV